MLQITEQRIEQMNADYPGIKDDIHYFESATLPSCPLCESTDTASVQAGLIQRTMNIAISTTKFKLIGNGPKPGKYFCNSCKSYF